MSSPLELGDDRDYRIAVKVPAGVVAMLADLKDGAETPVRLEVAPAVPELQAWLGLVATARGLLATHEYVRPCALNEADVEESDAQGPGA